MLSGNMQLALVITRLGRIIVAEHIKAMFSSGPSNPGNGCRPMHATERHEPRLHSSLYRKLK